MRRREFVAALNGAARWLIVDRAQPVRLALQARFHARFHAWLLPAFTLFAIHATPLYAQAPSPSAVLAPGFAIVSGFSGVLPGRPSPGANPVDKLAIYPDGVSLRAIDMSRLGGPPDAQVVAARKTLSIPASQIGQVFALALDDAAPPNIYAAATSVYGLPIVVPDTDGDGIPDRVRRGAPNAAFMPGLFGPAQSGGGPGSIWKIDGLTGAVSLFANVLLDGMPNTGAALGGLAYDPASRQIYVADRGSGMIHSFDLNGIETGRFDHGVQGLAAIGAPPVAFAPSARTSVQRPQFDSGNPQTWGYAPAARRVFGLAAHRGRLYYAVAEGLRVWSVSLAPDGAFGNDARLEIVVPPGAAPATEISRILFDDGGDMLLAERGAPSGAYDFAALRAHDTGRVLRFRPRQPGASGTPFLWEPTGDYAIGFLPNFQNGDGGIALGYGYEPDGYFNLGACGATLWSTGSQLRIASNPALAQRLAANGALPIDGLQGNAVSLLRPQNTPPLSSYFVDFDDVTERAGTPGHMGDVVTWRACPGISWLDPMYVEMLVVELWCPAGHFRSRNACVPTPCRPGEIFHRGRCVEPRCPPELRTPVRGLCCPAGSKWNLGTRKCEPPELCPRDRLTRDGQCCPAGQRVNTDGNCQPETCESGRRANDGRCCPVMSNGTTINVPAECLPPQRFCRIGESIGSGCVCNPPNMIIGGRCDMFLCPIGRSFDPAQGRCVCASGREVDGVCQPRDGDTPPGGCSIDRSFDPAQGRCVCKSGREAGGTCLPERVVDCTQGRQYDAVQNRCVCVSGREINGVCQPPGGDAPPPGDSARPCPPGQIARGNLCIVVDPKPEVPDDKPPGGDKTPPGLGTLVPPGVDRFPPPAYCQGVAYKLVGGTCCAGAKTACTMKPADGICPSGTEIEIGPPWSAYPMCCRSDTSGTCTTAFPPRITAPRCPAERPREDLCWDRFFPNLIAVAQCNAGHAPGVTCISHSDCGEGACCDRGVCLAAGSQATSVPPPSSVTCQAPLIQVGNTCCSPETIAAGLCRGGPPRSRPVCTGGKVFGDNACRCPSGTVENLRGVCVKQPSDRPQSTKKREPVCKKGFHREGGRCVPNVRRRPSPEPAPQAVPNISIGIGIGVGGGGRGIGRPGGGRPGTGSPPPLRPPVGRPN